MATKQVFSNFQEMITQSDRPLLVDFYAHWCGPCRMMTPILEEVNNRLQGKLRVVKIDTDKYPQMAGQYQIHALPTLVLFKDGVPVHRIEGVVQADGLIQQLDPWL